MVLLVRLSITMGSLAWRPVRPPVPTGNLGTGISRWATGPLQSWEHPCRDDAAVSPKEVATSVRHYEILTILAPELEERTVEPTLDTFLNVIRQEGGTIDNIDVWGRRRLAYEIDKYNDGIYAVMDVRCTPDAVKELDRQLNLNEAVLRTKVVRPEKE